jgi:broad specificity phosphatase PhoE
MQKPVDALVTPATTIYFVRHGETSENARQIVQGQVIDSPLNERGFTQVEAVGRRLANVALDCVYASTLLRARQTADAMRVHHPGVPLVLLPGLMEMSFGVLEGQSYAGENTTFFKWLGSRWAEGQFGDRVDGGESVIDVRDRAIATLDHIVARSSGKSVAVVTHGRFLRILLATILDDYSLDVMDELLHTNTAVSEIVHRDGGFVAKYVASDEHVAELAAPRYASSETGDAA